jgi:hypothetical protein
MNTDRLEKIKAQRDAYLSYVPPGVGIFLNAAAVPDEVRDFLTDVEPKIGWLIDEVERWRGLLAALEWIIGETIVVGDVTKFCPACKNAQADGHAPDCWLGAEVGR